jgi:glycosyltransferase involved in cell wall biosynthesis
VCLIQSAKAFSAAGFRVVICRNQGTMDPQLNELQPVPRLLDMDYPEVMIAGPGESALPIAAYTRALWRLNAVVREVEPALIYCSGGLPCQLAVPVGKLRGIPVLCHFHHPAIKRAYYFWLVKFADGVIFSSQYTKDHSGRKAKLSGAVVYNGVDLQRFQPPAARDWNWRSSLGIPSDAVVIGQVSQLIPPKRPDFLMRAFAALLRLVDRPLHLCLVGQGPLQAWLQELAGQLGVQSRVTITGYVANVTPYYQHIFDINVLASREEGLGISSLEGAACGLPVVVTRCTGLSETILENETGLSFELDDLNDLCGKLALLIADPALRTSMGRAGRTLIHRRFSSQAYDRGVVAAAGRLLQE